MLGPKFVTMPYQLESPPWIFTKVNHWSYKVVI